MFVFTSKVSVGVLAALGLHHMGQERVHAPAQVSMSSQKRGPPPDYETIPKPAWLENLKGNAKHIQKAWTVFELSQSCDLHTATGNERLGHFVQGSPSPVDIMLFVYIP